MRLRVIRTLAFPLLLLMLITLIGAGCGTASNTSQRPGSGSGTQATIGMNTANFTTHSATVQAGQPVTFDDTVNGGGYHILCVGTGTGGSNACQSASQAPAAPKELLGQGLTMNAGEKRQISFTTAGTYRVICTIHPGMYIDITVK